MLGDDLGELLGDRIPADHSRPVLADHYAERLRAKRVIDLGCGAGDIVVTAAKEFGARAIGVDIDPVRIKEANENVTKNNVQDRVKIIQGDIFDPNLKLGDATVITLYLLPSLNAKLAPRLKKELKPGTRIVSHAFDMMQAEPPWPAEKTQEVDGANIYLWTIPKR